MKKSEQIYIFILCFVGMIMASVAFSYRSFLIPTYKEVFNISNTSMGMIISFAQLTSMVFTYFGGKYCLRIGTKRIIAIGNFITATAIITISMSNSWITLLFGFCGVSSGIALTVLGMNTSLPLITLFSQAILMNFIHGMYGFGSTLIQRFLGWFITNNFDWRRLFLSTAIIYILAGFAALRAPIKIADDHKNHKSEMPHKRLGLGIILGLMLYVVAEFLLGSWIINYFQEGFNFSAINAATYSTLFYATFTFGRLVGGFILNNLDRFKVITSLCFIAALTVCTGQFLGDHFFYLIGLSGIFFSVVYPTTITLVNEVYEKNAPYVIGLTSSCVAIGTFIANILFGYLNDSIGVTLTFYMIPICLFISGICFFFVNKEHKSMIEKA